jgi:hypothetical protein
MNSKRETEKKSHEHSKYETMFSVERQSLEMAKRELSQFQAKNETISIEVIKFYLNCNILVN